METVEPRLREVLAQIRRACEQADRDPASVTLIGVSKTKPAELVRAAYELGVRHFGENYLQEAVEKIQTLQDCPAAWHYIGQIQSNKTRQIAEHFHWVHTVDRLKIAERLSAQCPADKTLNVLVQVNVDADPAKGGVAVDEAEALVKACRALPHLCTRGLMTILAQDSDPGASYQTVAQLFADIGATSTDIDQAQPWDTLSMGMSGDLDQAIAAGATHVRIGTALFGARQPRE